MIFKITNKEKQIGKKLYKKLVQVKRKNNKWQVASFKELFDVADKKEAQLLEKILSIKNEEVGKQPPFYGLKLPPKDIIKIKEQAYVKDGKIQKTRNYFLSKTVWLAFQKLNKAIKKELGKPLILLSGYRSPAYQLAMVFCNLYLNQWNLKKTLKRVALPGYSEHGYPQQQAIDIGPYYDFDKLEYFDKTEEYKWLTKNAHKFGFYLSFPRKNTTGVMFEPWHWHYKTTKN